MRILTPWALAGVTSGAVVSTAAAAAMARAIFIMEVLLGLDFEVQRAPAREGSAPMKYNSARADYATDIKLKGLPAWLGRWRLERPGSNETVCRQFGTFRT